MQKNQTSCLRCGECCKQGGPALHSQDLSLVRSGKLPLDSLITIRKGEMVHNPLANGVRPAACELIKIRGSGKEWNCCYFDRDKGCTIYASRPQACRVLECWNPEETLDLIEKDTLSRLDILEQDSPWRPLVVEYEEMYPCPDLQILADGKTLDQKSRNHMEQQVQGDLMFRDTLVKEHQLPLQEELFLFGRPIFQLLRPFGITVVQQRETVALRWP